MLTKENRPVAQGGSEVASNEMSVINISPDLSRRKPKLGRQGGDFLRSSHWTGLGAPGVDPFAMAQAKAEVAEAMARYKAAAPKDNGIREGDLPPPDENALLQEVLKRAGLTSGWVDAESIKPEDIEWMWKNRFIKSRINLISGMGDVGKDCFLCRCAASLTNRVAWLDGTPAGEPMRVGYVAFEDEAADTIVPRLMANGADLKKILIWDKNVGRSPTPNDLENIDVLLVSPLISLMSADSDMNREQDARSFLTLWQSNPDLTVIATAHLSKKQDLSVAMRVLGASGIVNFIRSNWSIQRDDQDKKTRLFLRLKANLSPDGVDGLKFSIEHVGPWSQSLAVMLAGTCDKSPDEVQMAYTGRMGDVEMRVLNWLRERPGKCGYHYGEIAEGTELTESNTRNKLVSLTRKRMIEATGAGCYRAV